MILKADNQGPDQTVRKLKLFHSLSAVFDWSKSPSCHARKHIKGGAQSSPRGAFPTRIAIRCQWVNRESIKSDSNPRLSAPHPLSTRPGASAPPYVSRKIHTTRHTTLRQLDSTLIQPYFIVVCQDVESTVFQRCVPAGNYIQRRYNIMTLHRRLRDVV